MLRLGIVGAGAMAEYHAKRFAGIEGVRVAAVCDHLPERARAFAEARGLAAFGDPEEMASSGAVDAISVASLDLWHKAPAIAALGRGLPVFCEKPLARSRADAAEMVRAADSAGVPAIVNFSKRNGGLLSLARRLVADGALGGALRLRASYLQSWLLQEGWGNWRESARWKWRLSESSSTHGALGDLGSHLLDAAILIAGEGLCVQACSGRPFRDVSPPPGAPWVPEGGAAFEAFEAALTSRSADVLIDGNWRSEGKIDAFVLRLDGDEGELEIDLERSRDSLFFCVRGGAQTELKVEACPSTYERFAKMASGSADPLPDEPIDFAQGLAVQGLIEDCAGIAGLRGTELGSGDKARERGSPRAKRTNISD